MTLPGSTAAAAGTSPRGVRTLRLETGAPHCAQLPPSAPASSYFYAPTTPLRPPVPVCAGHWRGDPRAVQAARGGAAAAPSAGAPREVAALRLPGLPEWGQSSRSPSLQLEGAGKEGPPNSSSASPLHPFLAPALGESGVWRLVILISLDRFAVQGFRRCPVGFPLFAVRVAPPAHLSRR